MSEQQELPESGTPLVLRDGTKIDPSSGAVIRDTTKYVQVPNKVEAQKIVTSTRRHIADLPLPPDQMNAVSLVLSYELFGLADGEIAQATGLSIKQIGVIRMSDAFGDLREKVVESIYETDSENIRTIFQQGSQQAAVGLIEAAQDEGSLGFAAKKEVLDRAGHTVQQIVQHNVNINEQSHLKIVHVTRGKEDDIPTATIEAEAIEID